MKNKYFVLLFLLFSFSSSICYSQTTLTNNIYNESSYAENRMACPLPTSCHNPSVRDSYIFDGSEPVKIVKTRVRILRETNGANPAATEEQVALQFHHLNLNYQPYGIQFTYIIDFIDDSSIRTVSTPQEIVNLITNNAIQTNQYCNIFLGSGPASLAFYPWLPEGDYGIFINASLQFYPANNRNSLTHEMGHALGLYHTFTGYDELPCISDCAENNNSTGDLVGDFCSDTPPQEANFGYGFTQTIDNCSGTPFPVIEHINYMGYSDNKTEFTPQQVARMHCLLDSYPTRIGWLDQTNPEIPYVYNDGTYVFEDSSSDFNWIDISTSGTEITGLTDDNVIGPIDIGFNIDFYNNPFNQIYIGSNGYVSFSPIQLNALFTNIPNNDANNGFLAPLLSDLNFNGVGNSGKVYFHSNQIDTFIVTFENIPFFNSTTGFSGSNTFQIIYSATDQSIVYQYLNMDDYYPPNMHQTRNPSVIGVESPDGQMGLEINNYRIPKNSTRFVIQPLANLGVEDESFTDNFRVFPNPTSGQITLKLKDNISEVKQINLYNVLGQRVKALYKSSNNDPYTNELKLNINNNGKDLQSGIYFIEINTGSTNISKTLILK